jgi:hypothetical protein
METWRMFGISDDVVLTCLPVLALSLAFQLEAVDAAPTPRGARPGGAASFPLPSDDGLSDVDSTNADADVAAGAHGHSGGFASAWVS